VQVRGREARVLDQRRPADQGAGEGLGVGEAARRVGDLGRGQSRPRARCRRWRSGSRTRAAGGCGGGQPAVPRALRTLSWVLDGGVAPGAAGRGAGGPAQEPVDDGGGVGLLQLQDVAQRMVGDDVHRQRVGGQLGRVEGAERRPGADGVVDPQGAVLGDLVDQGADEGVGPDRVGQALVEGGLDQGLEERLLAADAAQVGPGVAVPDAVDLVGEVAAAGQGESPPAVEVAATGLADVQARTWRPGTGRGSGRRCRRGRRRSPGTRRSRSARSGGSGCRVLLDGLDQLAGAAGEGGVDAVLGAAGDGTTRSRGMDSIEMRLRAGSTRTTRVVSLRWPPTSP
jgi:hypothetical protein